MEKGTVTPFCADVKLVADVESGGAPGASCDAALKHWVAQRGVDPEVVAVWTAGKEGLSRLESWGRWKVGLAGFLLVQPALVASIFFYYEQQLARY
jgi:hypothetical protein